MARITVTLQVGDYPNSRYDKVAAIELSPILLKDAMEALDFPKQDAPVFTHRICSPPETIRKVIINRKRLAACISDILATYIVNLFGANDTLMGYKITKKDKRSEPTIPRY